MAQKILIKNINRVYSLRSLTNKSVSILIDEQGIISEIGKIEELASYKVIDASELILSPGWVDIHTHVYDGVSDIGLDPDRIGPKTGVTTLVDTGSAGHINYAGFEKYIIKTHDYSIFEFLNYGSLGISRCNVICDYETDAFLQPEETLSCVQTHRKYIRGIKVRACKVVLKGRGVEIVQAASDLAKRANLPLMVHIGEPEPYLPDILQVLRAGDIVTHCFHGKPGNILNESTNSIIEEALKAKERGVLFDVGHGASSFDVNVAKKCISLGFEPDLIGSDLHAVSIQKNAVSLPVTMTKLHSCGISIKKVVECVTTVARDTLRIENFQGNSLLGKRADFTLFKTVPKNTDYYDASNNIIKTSVQFVPHYVVLGNTVVECVG